jgi:hypothetical protein
VDDGHYGCLTFLWWILTKARLDVVDLVKTTLESNFASKGLVHEDIAWDTIGLYTGELEQHTVVFDCGRVKVGTSGDN